MMSLRPYQEAALKAIADAQASGLNRLLVKKPTGTGKTVTFAAMLQWPAIRSWLEQFPSGQRRMLVIAHRAELLEQAAEKIQAANPGLLVCIEQADLRASIHADVIVASIQTLAAMGYRRLHRLIDHMRIRLVVVDEAHHAAAGTYRTTLAHLGFLPMGVATDDEDDVEAANFDDVKVMEAALREWDKQAPKDRLLVGVTATPNRTDAIGLGCVFQSIVYSYALRAAIEDGWLVPIVPYVVETETSLDAVRTTAGEFNQKDLAKAVNNAIRNKLAVAAWREKAQGRSTIAFTVDVAHAHSLAEEFTEAGISAAAISGATPKEERRELLRRFSAGELLVLCNCMVLTEGTDLPITGCILHAKPTKSATLYEQMTGRGLRLFEGKDDCIVIDVVDIARKHSLQMAPVLYGLPPGLKPKPDEDLTTLEDEFEAFREEYPDFDIDAALAKGHLTLADLRARAKKLNIWTDEPLGDFAIGRQLTWVRIGDAYRLAYKVEELHEVITVEKNMLGTWDVVLTAKQKTASGWHRSSQQTIGSNILDESSAAAVAEGFVQYRRPSAFRLKSATAPWRLKPASPGQLGWLKKLGAPIRPGMTAGEASDLLDRGKARQAR